MLLERRVVVRRLLVAAATLTASATTRPVLPAHAALNPYDNPNSFVPFDTRPCAKRTLLGGCEELSDSAPPRLQAEPLSQTGSKPAAPAPPANDYVQGLLTKSRDNADANAKEVREKTLANGMGGAISPFSSSRAVMTSDGLQLIKVSKFEALRDRGKVVLNANGLWEYAPGFDPLAPDPAPEASPKLFGFL